MAVAKKAAKKVASKKTATKKPAAKTAAPKAGAKAAKSAAPASGKPNLTPAALKPITARHSKTELFAHIAQHANVDTKAVKAVFASLEATILASLHKKGAGLFVMPGLFKVTAVQVPAKPKRKGIDPFTKVERMFAAKPATTKVKVRALKRVVDASR